LTSIAGASTLHGFNRTESLSEECHFPYSPVANDCNDTWRAQPIIEHIGGA